MELTLENVKGQINDEFLLVKFRKNPKREVDGVVNPDEPKISKIVDIIERGEGLSERGQKATCAVCAQIAKFALPIQGELYFIVHQRDVRIWLDL